MSPIPLGILAASGAATIAPFVLLETQVLASNQASVTFSNLNTYATQYRHLHLRVVARETTGAGFSSMGFRFNGNASGYTRHSISSNGSSVGNDAATNEAVGFLGPVTHAGSPANSFGTLVIDIVDPFSAKTKVVRTLNGNSVNSTGLYSSLWNNTEQITSLAIFSRIGDNLAAGSRFSLYGVRG
jgi:hypothetical protein